MVYVKEDTTETVTNAFETKRDGLNGVVVKTDDGYFEYWFPIKDAPDYIDSEKVLSAFSDMTITEAPGEENETQHDGTSNLTIPQSVVEKAEEVTGYHLPE
jgi:hypothetical protein